MRKLFGLSLLPVVSIALALEAPVEELGTSGASASPIQGASPVASTRVMPAAPVPEPLPQNQALMDLHYEVQSLRDEVRDLRGIVEEQANELRQLRQRQLDDYQDLDRRISDVGTMDSGSSPQATTSSSMPMSTSQGSMNSVPPADTFGSSSTSSTSSASMSTDIFSASATSEPSEGEYEAYTRTYNLLKARKIDEAVAGFNVFVAKFPNGQYTANAYYWLGEIYMLQDNLPEAAKAFAMVKDRFPAHRKANDAKFKLAKVYHLQGNLDESKALLAEVAATNSSAASLAKAYLSENF